MHFPDNVVLINTTSVHFPDNDNEWLLIVNHLGFELHYKKLKKVFGVPIGDSINRINFPFSKTVRN